MRRTKPVRGVGADAELGLVVGVDFSDGAAAAVVEARLLADQLGLDAQLVHVVEDGVETPGPLEIGAWLTAHNLEGSTIQVLRGVAWIELGRLASSSASRLLVVGSHGRSGFQPLEPGRTAMRLALRSPIPVLVVPASRMAVTGESPAEELIEHAPEGFRRLGKQ